MEREFGAKEAPVLRPEGGLRALQRGLRRGPEKMNEVLVRTKGLTKEFSSVRVLDDISVDIRKGRDPRDHRRERRREVDLHQAALGHPQAHERLDRVRRPGRGHPGREGREEDRRRPRAPGVQPRRDAQRLREYLPGRRAAQAQRATRPQGHDSQDLRAPLGAGGSGGSPGLHRRPERGPEADGGDSQGHQGPTRSSSSWTSRRRSSPRTRSKCSSAS